VYWRQQLVRFRHGFSHSDSMIADDFHIMAVPIAPHKTDEPLIVNANRVLVLAITAQRLRLISGRRGQRHSLFGRSMQLQQFAQGEPLERAKPARMPVVKQFLGFCGREASITR